jgi:hypothetical protein
MKKRQPSTRNTAKHTSKRCPKCGSMNLTRNGHTPAGKSRWMCATTHSHGKVKNRVVCYTTTNPEAPYRDQASNARGADKNPQFRRALGNAKRFIITAAQNATPVHKTFFASLTKYAKVNDAELIVIPLRYRNPTSRWSQSQENAEWWDVAVKPFLYNQRKKLNENLVLLADAKTVPTATKPLSRFESVTAGESGILGHTKLQMVCIPTPQGKYPKIMATTGACTEKNYTDTKAGKIGEFHHALAALVVEIVGRKFFIRHVNATSDGSFIDLKHEYSGAGVIPAPPALALVFGDTHRQFIDKGVERVTYGHGGMVDTLDPEYLIFHDLHDGYSRNPHHRLDPFSEIAKRGVNMHLVEREVHDDVKWLVKTTGKRKAVVVPSNHDNFFARWILDTDWRRDPDNASFYLETAKVMVDSTHMTESGASRVDPFTYWVDRLKGKAPITCLKRDQSFVLGGVELSLHGDQGPNGARGSRDNLRRIGVKTIVGHSHTPGIEEGCYQTGTSTPLKLEYNSGPSNWLHAHVVLYANGKRAILPIIDGAWCFDAAQE